MSQNDYVIANQTAPNFRADLNLALQALASNSSGATAPATTYANMLWYDTANNILKMRSEADDAWIDLGTLDQSTNTFTPSLTGVPTQNQTVWDAGTDTTESFISPAKLDAKINAEVPSVLNATGAAPLFAARAWALFDGAGTPSITASGNVATITDAGADGYTVTFSTAMPDANYVVVGTVEGNFRYYLMIVSQSASGFTFKSFVDGAGSNHQDSSRVQFVVFR